MSWARWSLWTGLSGFGAAALTVPASMALGHEIGKHPSNYIAAALPGLLLLLALPPAAVFTTEYLLGRHLKLDRLRLHPAFWTALGVQLVTMVVAIAAGATTRELGRASAFAAADAVILPGTVTLMLYLTRRKAPPVPRVHPAPSPLTAHRQRTRGGRDALLSLGEQPEGRNSSQRGLLMKTHGKQMMRTHGKQSPSWRRAPASSRGSNVHGVCPRLRTGDDRHRARGVAPDAPTVAPDAPAVAADARAVAPDTRGNPRSSTFGSVPLGALVLTGAALVLAGAASAARGQACPHRDQWPTYEWPSREAEHAAARSAEIAALEDYAFTLVGDDVDREGIRTDSVIIVQGGAIVYERYGRGFDATMRHLAWSVTKSITKEAGQNKVCKSGRRGARPARSEEGEYWWIFNRRATPRAGMDRRPDCTDYFDQPPNALVGRAVARGELDINDSICDHLEPVRPENCDILVVDLLEMASGLDWAEVYEGQSNQESSVLAMLYGEGHRDMAGFVLGQTKDYCSRWTR